MATLAVKALDPTTWPDFARLVEKHNGVWGGCWCIAFHIASRKQPRPPSRVHKEQLVREGRAHAALVYDGDDAVGWCQFGPTAELPGIKRGKAYEAGLTTLPDWRITCFFTDRNYRGKGVSTAALKGALAEIARLGGGLVESYPEDVEGRKDSRTFLHNATLAQFEAAGFHRQRQLGKNHWVVTKTV